MHSQFPAGHPAPSGLYDPRFEHDACGVSFVVNINGVASHDIVAMGIGALCNMEHRGATGAEADSGDGAGVLIQVPDRFLRGVVPFELPVVGSYAVGLGFLPADATDAEKAQGAIESIIADEGLSLLGWRAVPVRPDCLGKTARAVMPSFQQLFVAEPSGAAGIELDRKLFVVRKRIEHELPAEQRTYFPSLSSRTLIYKGMFTTPQLAEFFPDLSDERVESALALVHSRFSTNTFPSWPLAHPYRYIAHNGEINTVQGNRNWMRTRESLLASDLVPGLDRAFPICTPGGSDSATFDEVLELLHLGGRSLPHAMLMMIPEAWENHDTMDAEKRAFYRFHSSLMEPWDGPASVAFTDGTVIGAVLDRNGLRPSRYWVTDDDIVIMASEVGVIDLDPAKVVRKGRLQPGRMFLIDTAQGRIVGDEEVKLGLAQAQPYQQWLDDGLVELKALPEREHIVFSHQSVLRRQQVFGYTHEELKILVAPMAKTGLEPIGSMGRRADRHTGPASHGPGSALSLPGEHDHRERRPRAPGDGEDRPRAHRLDGHRHADRGAQRAAAVAVRLLPAAVRAGHQPAARRDSRGGRHIGGLHGGPGGQPAGARSGELSPTGPALPRHRQRRLGEDHPHQRRRCRCGGGVPGAGGGRHQRSLPRQRWRLGAEADVYAPIPSLLLTAAVHHHLIREQQRTKVGLVVECGDAREVHHMALLIGYGAGAINPYLAFESIESMIAQDLHGLGGMDPAKAQQQYIKAAGKGVLKVMSKMGVSTVASYTGAQIFEAIGLGRDLVDEYFTGTVSRLGGIGLDEVAAEVAARHTEAHPRRPEERAYRKLELGGEYQWRREGDIHLFNPETVFKLQHGTRAKRYDIFQQYTALVDGLSKQAATLRGLFELRAEGREPVALDEVEPVSEIVKRFSTGAMSYGSISMEAHETLAIAMNSIGAKSNTGEGGEDADRLHDPQRRSSIKQVASGRFGVTSEYLVNADDLQIKMAQGAKPGEGGQLPGHKVYPWVAKTRHSTPGVGLISPPPHHDIYSIEDLKQLIHDLKNSNPAARVHVKLVSEVGVGTVAAGVSKAKADVVLISGHDGGTGASPLTSLKHAGAPWELGLAETQQTLLLNGLRDRIVVQADGQLKTGRDVVIAALLGAEEFGFATAPLVVSGCIMMRVCHLDTCPVGVATQNPELRKKFSGKPEFVVTFMEYIAEEVREHMAALGFRTMQEMIGHVEVLDTRSAITHWKAKGLDISPILAVPSNPYGSTLFHSVAQDHGLDDALDQLLLRKCAPAIERAEAVTLDLPIRNVNRTVGTMLGSAITKAHGGAGLPDGTISLNFRGSAGQSFGAFVPAGVTMTLEGDANDYVGKGLSGGRVVVRPDRAASFAAEDNVIAGNVIGYGATSGEMYLRGLVGERFCVRNSGATAVVEGVGDHGCEYMTGGRVVVLGPTGRNFGAGMSGGIAYVYDPLDMFEAKLNRDMVQLQQLDDVDRSFVLATVGRHAALTGSPVAQRIVADWVGEAGHFKRVMPVDYERVLGVMARAEADGLDEAATLDRVMEASRG